MKLFLVRADQYGNESTAYYFNGPEVISLFNEKDTLRNDDRIYDNNWNMIDRDKLIYLNREVRTAGMSLKEFFKEFTIEELVGMYKYRIQDDLAKESLKEIIMERLELPDEDSFKLYIELF